MKIRPCPSPNYDSRNGAEISLLVLHYTGMVSGQAALARLCEERSKVSAHYLVEEDGRIFQLVPEAERAWHAGVSRWRGMTDINARSIGIEIVNPGHEHGYRVFPAVQMRALAGLCEEILTRHPAIQPRNVVGHSDIAPGRKEDPGERFDWPLLARQSIGLWPAPDAGDEDRIGHALAEWGFPEESREGDAHRGIATFQQGLAEYGYAIPLSGLFDRETTHAVRAFQRHFRREKVDGVWDVECQARLEALLKMVM